MMLKNVAGKDMSKRAASILGGALFLPLALLSGVAAAGPLPALPAVSPSLTTAHALAAPSSSMSALSVAPVSDSLPAASASPLALGVQSPAALPGLDSAVDDRSKATAQRGGASGNSIRPIRVPPFVVLPLPNI